MPSDYRTAAALAALGLLLVTNTVWLFPHENDTEYTYERAEITVENGTIHYLAKRWDHANDVDEVDCQDADGTSRACGFDAHLAADGPVTVQGGDAARYREATYVRLHGDYYRRLRGSNGSATTYDVEPVEPRELLADVAVDTSETPSDDVWEDAPLQYRIAVTGETTTTREVLEDDQLGTVFHRNGTYYTVVVTEWSTIDRGLPNPGATRALIRWVGLFVLLAALLRASEHTDWD